MKKLVVLSPIEETVSSVKCNRKRLIAEHPHGQVGVVVFQNEEVFIKWSTSDHCTRDFINLEELIQNMLGAGVKIYEI